MPRTLSSCINWKILLHHDSAKSHDLGQEILQQTRVLMWLDRDKFSGQSSKKVRH